jgi:hypothetical protein
VVYNTSVRYGGGIRSISCIPILNNNTVSRNEALNSGWGGGLQGNFTGTNCIVYNNYAYLGPEIYEGYCMLTYTCCATTIVGTGNITSNPQFVDPINSNFHLQSTSPCIDTGNPTWPLDPDSTRADMGAWYYDQSAPPPTINVTMTPLNPPINIPANGGSFQFNATVQRNVGPAAPFYAWARNRYPNGAYSGNLLGPVNINPPVGVTVTRQRTQVVDAAWPAGVNYYVGYANTVVGYPPIDADSFAWTKLTTSDGGPMVWEVANYGESFSPYEVVTGRDACPTSFALIGAAPNPFNPTTAISYQLTTNSFVSLKVYDTAGRLVTTLVDGWREAGIHQATFDGSGLAAGVYLVRFEAAKEIQIQKVVLVK